MLSRTQWWADYALMAGMQRGLADCSSLRDSADFLVACWLVQRKSARGLYSEPSSLSSDFHRRQFVLRRTTRNSEATVVNKAITVIDPAQEGLLSEMDVTPVTKAFDRAKVHLPLAMV